MKKTTGFTYLLLIFLILYSLFAFSSIKTIGAPIIDGIKGNNMLFLIGIVWLFRFLFMKKTKSNLKVFISIFIAFSFAIISFIFNKNSQSLYAVLIAFLPLLLVSTANEYEGKKFKSFLKIVTLLSIVYSLFVFLEFLSYDFFALKFSLSSTASYVTRHATMLGTSITTSYYFILNIPFEVIAGNMLEKKWKKYTYLSIILSVIAIIISQSRICFITLGVYFVFYFLNFNKNIKLHNKVLIILLVSVLMVWVLNNDQLSRLYQSYGESFSTETRVNVLKIGIDEFSRHPIVGSGIATYYKRLWNSSTRFVVIHNSLSLIDPHNMFIYILVEQGLVGGFLLLILFYNLKKDYYNPLPSFIKKNIKILLIGLIIIFCCGSQLINEINYSVLFWTYFTFLFSYSLCERNDLHD